MHLILQLTEVVFFRILNPDGRLSYTRAGVFGKNAEGLLTTPSGFVLQPEIEIPEGVTSINVSADGIVSVQIPGEVEAEEVGQLQLADFLQTQQDCNGQLVKIFSLSHQLVVLQ